MDLFNKKEKKEMRAIYLTHAIDALAFSISSIFVPIFLLSSGETVRIVALYFIIHNIVLLLAAIISGIVASKFGLRKCLMLRYPFLFAYLFMLTSWGSFGNVYFLAVFSGLAGGFFGVPLNIFFGRHAGIRGLGSKIAKLSVVPQLAGLGGPLLGGILAALFGFKSLFIITFVISIFSLLPLFLCPDLKDYFKFNPRKGLSFFLRSPKLLVADMVDNIGGETEGIIWPIFVFLILNNTVSVGIVGTFIAIGSLLFTVFVGQATDKKSERSLIRLAVPLLILIWGIRVFIQADEAIYLTTVAAGFVLTLFTVPYTRLLFAKAKRERNESFFVMKEVPTILGRLVILTLFFVFANNITWLFPIAGLSYLYFLFL